MKQVTLPVGAHHANEMRPGGVSGQKPGVPAINALVASSTSNGDDPSTMIRASGPESY